MVANRAIDPMSKLATAEWANNDVAVPGLEAMDEDQAYRAMDLLVAADAQAEVQEAVFFAVADLLNLEVDLLFFDTTSTYFERDSEDDGDDAFRRYGHSKDHRPDLPQIVIGLAVTREGIPVRVWCWPGNTNDQAVLPEVKDGLRGWRLGRVVTVVDRGFSSDANLDYLRRAGGHWIAGERCVTAPPMRPTPSPGRAATRRVRDNLRVKEVRSTSTPDRRWIVCHNPVEAERDKAKRDATIARLEAELDAIAAGRARDAAKAKTRKSKRKLSDDAHRQAECALRDHPTLGRYLRQTADGTTADRPRQDPRRATPRRQVPALHLRPRPLRRGRRARLQEPPRSRTRLPRPQVHPRTAARLPPPRRPASAPTCCCAGSPCSSSASPNDAADTTWRRIAIELGRVHAVTLQGSAGTVVQTTPLSDAAAGILDACGIDPPPRITHLHPA